MTQDRSQYTATLVQRLAGEAGGPPRARQALMGRLLAGAVVSLALAVAVVAAVFGLRNDLATHLASMIYLFKAAVTGLGVLAGLALVHAAGTPGAPMRVPVLLLPAVLVLVLGLVAIDSEVTLRGVRAVSVPVCVAAIVLAALPALAIALALLRSATPTRPVLAGSVAGLLAGAIGALAYTLACRNDGPGFVAAWYTLAILVVALLGASAGRRVLAW